MAKPSESRYKDKYLELLDEFEAKERQWRDVQQTLPRIFTHLLIISDGPADKEISKDLADLRAEIRKDFDFQAVEKKVELIKSKVLEEGRADETFLDMPPIHQVLIQLIERIPLPEQLNQKALKIIEDLETGIRPEKVHWAISSIAWLVVDVRNQIQKEKKELEKLLDEIGDKLSNMGKGLASAEKHAMDGFEANRFLDKAVREEMIGMKTSASKAKDLQDLRHELTVSIETITRHLEDKTREDGLRQGSFNKEVAQLNAHVKELESEVSAQKEKVRLAREMSHKDPLTGCLNRLAYEERIAHELNRKKRSGTEVSLLFFDLDDFKKINDTFGHQAGDQVLKAIAKIANSQIRGVDFFGRLGGEEFVAILPETPLEGARKLAEKVRKAIEQFRFHHKGNRVVVTISCGIAEMRQDEAASTLLDRADKALYKAKARGKNCCVDENEK